jgi:hypothetical protein
MAKSLMLHPTKIRAAGTAVWPPPRPPEPVSVHGFGVFPSIMIYVIYYTGHAVLPIEALKLNSGKPEGLFLNFGY